MGEHQGNTSISTKNKLQFYLQMSCPSLSGCLPSVKGISLYLSGCLGMGSFHVSGTPGIKKHLRMLRIVCCSARSWQAQPQGGQRDWIRVEPLRACGKSSWTGEEGKKCLRHAKRLCQASPTTLMGLEMREHIQTLDCHWMVGIRAQNHTLDWVRLQPKHYLQFGFLGVLFLCLTYSEISELLRLWIPPRIYNHLINSYQPGNHFIWSSHISAFVTVPSPP